jgi:hypothetical protein
MTTALTPPEPMQEQAVRQRAYELYVQRGRVNGHAVDDWLRAEAEIVHGHSSSDSNPGATDPRKLHPK